MAQTFGELLKKHREKLGESIQGFARKSDTPAGTICLVENMRLPPPADCVIAWEKALGLDPKEHDTFWIAAIRQCASHGDRRMAPYFRFIDTRLATMAQLITALAALGRKPGTQIPHALVQRIKSIDNG